MFLGDLLGRPDVQHSRVVHKNVEATKTGLHFGKHAVDFTWFGNVGRDNHRLATGFFGYGIEGICAASNQREFCAFTGKGQGDSATDPSSGAGDESSFS